MTLALYRAYRPGTLAEVVGQDHVTGPLGRALSTGRVHHAYLFSGPRGCGKTSTARILARSLNCERGPTPDPCGQCDSCVALAPNGPGSQDVIELDAASHGGVDDTRELRERVIYSPAQSRYRIYIIDEAHMVTTQGFNALLKVIEEPPEYVRFIFATTEPEKVLGTIRSRTFNYAFRLVSVGVLSAHLASVCQTEQVPFAEPALPLIAQAAGGSVRDALSILGQLIAGSGDEGLTTEFVSSGLGLTDSVLLDRVVAAIAARDGAAAFCAVDAVVESGHDGRRFLTDLLGRLRDLIVLQYVDGPERAALLQLPADQVDALAAQPELFGRGELSRAADLVSAGLSELKGATAPRLQLELLLARLLLPAADDDEAGLRARIERLERAVAAGAVHTAPVRPATAPERPATAPERPAAVPKHAAARAPAVAPTAPVTAGQDPRPGTPVASAPSTAAAGGQPTTRRAAPPKLSDLAPASAGPVPADAAAGAVGTSVRRGSDRPVSGAAKASATPAEVVVAPSSSPPAGAAPANPRAPLAAAGAASAPPEPTGPSRAPGVELSPIRDGWPAVLTELGKRSRVAWALWESSVPTALADGALIVSVADQGRLSSIKASRREELLRQVLIDVLRIDAKVVPVLASQAPVPESEAGDASPDDPDLGDSEISGVDLLMREFGAVPIGEIGES